MLTVGEIAREAFDGVAAEVSGVIKPAILQRVNRGVYNPATGVYQDAREEFRGRALFADEAALADVFPSYVVGAGDRLVYVEGLATMPRESERLEIGGRDVVITRVGDIVGAGSFFALVVRDA